MGLFDLPAPLFAWLDDLVSGIAPPTLRLVLWGVIGAVVSMALYWALSPQSRIARTKAQALEARRAVDSYDGDFSGARPLIASMLRLAIKQVGLVFLPAVAASLPLLALIVWLSTAYGNYFPPAESHVEVRTFPEKTEAQWLNGNESGSHFRPSVPRIVFSDDVSGASSTIAVPEPISTIHKYQWWNVLIGNPVGYLPEDASIDRIQIDLPQKDFIAFGPPWLRSWATVFFASLIACSIAIKTAFRID